MDILDSRPVKKIEHKRRETSRLENNVIWRLKTGMVKPEQTSIAEKRIEHHVPVTSSNERVVAR
jgi:hypothetical protein